MSAGSDAASLQAPVDTRSSSARMWDKQQSFMPSVYLHNSSSVAPTSDSALCGILTHAEEV